MRINHNIAALNTYRQLSANGVNQSKSLEKLSSGLRINRAGDDAAGLAISEKMRGQIRGLDQAARNAQDGISLIQTAEGALAETHSILQRMRELAVQSANDTNTANDRSEIQKEVDQLAVEITRIANNTEFNTQKLLNGGMTEVGIGKSTFHIGANANQNIDISISAMDAKTLGVSRDVINVEGTGVGIVDSATFGTILGAGNTTDAATLTFQYNAAQGATNAKLVGDAAAAPATSLTGLDNGTTIKINVNGTNYIISNATLKGYDGSGTENDLANLINNADTNGDGSGTALNTVATASFSGGKLQIVSSATGEAATVTWDINEGAVGDVATLETAFGFGDAATAKGADATGANVTISDSVVSQAIAVTDLQATTLSVTSGRYNGLTISLATGNNITGLDSVNDKLTLAVTSTNATAADFSGQALVRDAVTEAGIDVSTKTAANSAITVIEAAITTVSAERSKLGAYQNRLEHTIANLGTSSENLTASESRIRDVDMAKEMMEFTKNNILSQAAQAMLAQANQQPQGVLQLLQ